MRRALALSCCLCVLLAAWLTRGSAVGFLLGGPGAALLLDYYLFRLLPWPPAGYARDLAGSAAAFLLGGAVFYCLRPGLVPWWEAVWRGGAVCVVVFLGEQAARLTTPAARPHRRWWARAVLVTAFVLLAPALAALHPLHTVPKRPPAGLDCQEVRFRTADGVRLAGWFIAHPEARGDVVLCHGHGRNRGHLAGLIPTLRQLRLNVLAFDFRGHGASGGETSTFGNREVRDLAAAVAWLHARGPRKPLFLVGVSLGAAVILQALPGLEGVAGVWTEGAFAHLAGVIERPFAVLPDALRHPVVRTFCLLAWLDCGLSVGDANPVRSLARTHVPIFFCHGRQDELVPLQEGRALYQACRGPRRRWWVEGASHYNVRQRNREEYLSRLRGFLQECL
jgi:alpha-beta hydrolase superfamily lysophospholipase